MPQSSSSSPCAEKAIRCPSCDNGFISSSGECSAVCGQSIKTDGRILVLGETPAEEDYPSEGAGAQQSVLDKHFWFRSRNELIQTAIRHGLKADKSTSFVELGCSNGFVMSAIESIGLTVTGVDMHIGGLRNAAERVDGQLICSRVEELQFTHPVAGVGLFDVIEHVEEDSELLRHAISLLEPGGLLFVTVPALQSLWSEFDEILGHKRRYTRKQLRSLLSQVGFDVLDSYYAFSFAVPIVWLQRRLVRRQSDNASLKQFMSPPRPMINQILYRMARLEALCRRFRFRLPFGTSLLAVAQRPKSLGNTWIHAG